jgi:tRNA-modifying protein YgfZ
VTSRVSRSPRPPELEAQVDALDRGAAFTDLTMWRKISVTGADARAWLNDLLTADLSGLQPGSAVRSFLLSRTGHVRADVGVLAGSGGYLLVQDPIQDEAIDRALAPYVLSADVALTDSTRTLGLLAFPRAAEGDRLDLTSGEAFSPSVFGRGVDVVVAAERVSEARDAALARGLVEATAEAVEAWRIRRGQARAGVDLGPEAVPLEAATSDLIAEAKGCYLGQEAVARIRNLGHPPFVLLAAHSPGTPSPGDPVRADGAVVGTVTSAEPADTTGSAVIVRVRWAARESDLASAEGHPLHVRGPAMVSG